MNSLLETPRLFLKLASPSDADVVLQFFQQNQDFLKPWSPKPPKNYYQLSFWELQLQQDSVHFIHDQSMRLYIYEKQTGNLTGRISFTNFERGVFQSCRLGYLLGEKYQGLGYMSEALSAAIEYVFDVLDFHRIEANYMPRNERSGKLLARLGFRINGTEDQYLQINGKWECHHLTSRINSNWRD